MGKADGETFSKREMLLNAHLSCFADTSTESRASRQTFCRAGSWVHFVFFFKMKHSEWKLISLFLGWREGKKVWLHLWCCAGMERATLPNRSREDDKRQQHFFPPSIYGAKIHLLLQSLKKNKIKFVTYGCLCNSAKIIQSEISLKVRTQPSVHI